MSESIPCSFITLNRHSIFQPSPLRSGQTDSSKIDKESSINNDIVPPKKSRLLMRDKEIILAIGKEIRLANLSGDGFEVRNGIIGKYSTLVSSNLNFEIQSIRLNPTGRLLAVVGISQIVVLVLPRTGSTIRGEVSCRSIVIDSPQYSASSSVGIAKVLWHPLGQGGESLWILSTDGQLREYDIQTPYDPIQTFSFLPPSLTSSSRFSAADPLSRIATSFTFGPTSQAGWGECTIYGLLANGDLYTLCPVIPFRTEVSLKWVQKLKAYITEKGGEEERYWLDSLTKQIQLDGPSSSATPASPTPNMRKSILGRSTRDPVESVQEIEVDGDQIIRLHPPHLTLSGGPAPGLHMEIERQGPATFDPAPPEGDDEDIASDLVLVSVETAVGVKGKEGRHGEVRILAVCWRGGRVDIGVEVDRAQGRWVGSSGTKSNQNIASIPILESIQLDVPEHLAEENAPSFTGDLLHADTLYVQHIRGVDAISVLNVVSALLGGAKDIPGCDVAQLIASGSTKPQPMEGLATCYNFSLGYGVLAITPDNRLAAVELDYRGSDKTDPAQHSSTILSETEAESNDRASLLTSNPFDLPSVLSSLQHSPSLSSVRSALKKFVTPGKPLTHIGAEHLRAIGDIIVNIQNRIEALKTASQLVERHLDLQVQEFQRQLQVLKTSQDQLEIVRKHDAVKRAEGMMLRQGALAGRMDKVLSGLTAMYRPPIGEVERNWFDELEVMRVRVQGGKGWGVNRGGGLKAQVEELEDQLDDIKPSVEKVNKELGGSEVPKKKIGAREIRPIESALYSKMDEIGRLMRRMEGLKVEVEEALDGSSPSG